MRSASVASSAIPVAAVPRDHGRKPPGIGLRRLMGSHDLAARGAVEQLDAARDRLAAVLRLDSARVGLVDEDELAGGVAVPYRSGNRINQRANGRGVVELLAVALGQFRKLVFDAADLAQPQDCAPADDLAFRLDDVICQRRHRHGKAHAAGAQRIDGTFQVTGRFGREPGAESEDPLGMIGAGHQHGIADDLRLVCRGRPGDNNLRLGEQQCIGAVDGRAGRNRLVALRCQRGGKPLACAHEQDRSDDRETQDGKGERERGDLVPIEQQESRSISLDR